MTQAEVLIAVGCSIFITVIYILLRKFVVWAIDDEQKWHNKKGHLGDSKDGLKDRKNWALWELTAGYLVILAAILIFSLIKAGVIK